MEPGNCLEPEENDLSRKITAWSGKRTVRKPDEDCLEPDENGLESEEKCLELK